MNFEEFEEKYNQVLRNGDELLLFEIKGQLNDASEPACYELIAYLHDPDSINKIDGKDINKEIKARLIDTIEENHYKKLAFQSYKARAEAGDYNHMSHLAELYILGEGTDKDQDKADYWLDKLYLEKTGMKFKEWEKNNA